MAFAPAISAVDAPVLTQGVRIGVNDCGELRYQIVQFDGVAFLPLVSQRVKVACHPGISKHAGGVRVRGISGAGVAGQVVRIDAGFSLRDMIRKNRLLFCQPVK